MTSPQVCALLHLFSVLHSDIFSPWKVLLWFWHAVLPWSPFFSLSSYSSSFSSPLNGTPSLFYTLDVLKLVCIHSGNDHCCTKEPQNYSFSLVSLWCSIFTCLGNNSTCACTIVISSLSPRPQTTHISTSANDITFSCSHLFGWNTQRMISLNIFT